MDEEIAQNSSEYFDKLFEAIKSDDWRIRNPSHAQLNSIDIVILHDYLLTNTTS
jgi:hypothetical protein